MWFSVDINVSLQDQLETVVRANNCKYICTRNSRVEAAAHTEVRRSFLLIPNMPIWGAAYARVFISILQYQISNFQTPSAVKVRGAVYT